jgi:hypothetical protein
VSIMMAPFDLWKKGYSSFPFLNIIKIA